MSLWRSLSKSTWVFLSYSFTIRKVIVLLSLAAYYFDMADTNCGQIHHLKRHQCDLGDMSVGTQSLG